MRTESVGHVPMLARTYDGIPYDHSTRDFMRFYNLIAPHLSNTVG
jgi:hypothetical protein